MWSSGERIVARYRSSDGRFLGGRPLTVVDDGADWLVTYQHVDSVHSFPVLADGRGLRDVPLAERCSHPRTRELRTWRGHDMLLLFPRAAAYSVWIFRDGRGGVDGWYVNIEEPHRRTGRTIDTRDWILDIWAPSPGGDPQWKDEDELEAAERVGRVTADEARAIRAEGERVWRERPWPTGWEDFEPPPEWPVPELPPGWFAGPLETDRLVLAPVDRRDLDDLRPIYGDGAERELDLSDASWRADDVGFWGARDESGELVGVVELHRAGDGLVGIEAGELELGWIVRDDRRRRGYATEAVRAAICDLKSRACDLKFRACDFMSAIAYIAPDNDASKRVAEKLGLTKRGDGLSRDGGAIEIYELRLG